jgi:hypothetical protein
LIIRELKARNSPNWRDFFFWLGHFLAIFFALFGHVCPSLRKSENL